MMVTQSMHFKRLLLAILTVMFIATAQAELVIEITKGSGQAIPIAVVPFANRSMNAVPEDVSRIIGDNLQRTGQFKPLERGNMLSLPSSAAEVFFRDWKMLGQRYLLIGSTEFSPGDGQYRLRYELYDVFTQERVLGEVVSGPENRLRDLAHYVSDAIYEALTGVKGIFSTKIAYVTLQKRGSGAANYQLEVADADGRRSNVILKSDQPIMSPSWSPDGTRLAYVSFEGKRPAIYSQDIASGRREKLTGFQGLNGAPAFSPDGRKLAMTLSKDGNPEIYVMDLQTKNLQRITNHWAIDTEPSWSPDGRSLIFTSDRGGGPQIYRADVTNPEGLKRLTFEGKYNSRPRFSPDGRKLYFVHQRGGNFRLASMDIQSGEMQLLSDTGLDESPSVAPNGSMLIYATRQKGQGVLAVVGVETGAKYILPSSSGDVREPAWSPFLK
jgi:TolB protein